MFLRHADLTVLLVLVASNASATTHTHASHRAGTHGSRAATHSTSHAHSHPVGHHHPVTLHHQHTHAAPHVIASIVAAPRPLAGTRSTGCGGAPTAPGVSEQTVLVRGVSRTFLLSVPAGYDPAIALPLVFAFHGRTGTPASLRSYLRLEREAAGGAVFVYPAGLREIPVGADRSVTHWDVGPDGADIAFFDAILDGIANSYCIDRGRVFAVGHSAGAEVTNEMGCQRGNVLRAIAPIAGMGPYERRCTPPPSVWLTHGRADAPVPFHHGEASRDHWIAAARCSPEPVLLASSSCEHYVNCADEVRVIFCPHDGDHGPPPFAPHEIWAFFSSAR